MPVALEYLTKLTYPGSPEVSSTVAWTGGQLLGAIFIVIMDALKADANGQPPYNMRKALIFEAIVACITVPLPLIVGIERLGLGSGKISNEALIRDNE
jgi:MFS transporter, FLVCR family, MFS-domain-containing protein 7